MIALFSAVIAGQLYAKDLSISFARAAAKAPPISITPKSTFKVSILNGTKEKTTLMNDSCSWGYDAMSFDLKSPSGKEFHITRVEKNWNRNFPRGDKLDPIGMKVRTINFADKTWEGFPAGISGNMDGWQVRVNFKIPKSLLYSDEGFWSGEIHSNWVPATMRELVN